jgi:hypothetical protein
MFTHNDPTNNASSITINIRNINANEELQGIVIDPPPAPPVSMPAPIAITKHLSKHVLYIEENDIPPRPLSPEPTFNVVKAISAPDELIHDLHMQRGRAETLLKTKMPLYPISGQYDSLIESLQLASAQIDVLVSKANTAHLELEKHEKKIIAPLQQLATTLNNNELLVNAKRAELTKASSRWLIFKDEDQIKAIKNELTLLNTKISRLKVEMDPHDWELRTQLTNNNMVKDNITILNEKKEAIRLYIIKKKEEKQKVISLESRAKILVDELKTETDKYATKISFEFNTNNLKETYQQNQKQVSAKHKNALQLQGILNDPNKSYRQRLDETRESVQSEKFRHEMSEIRAGSFWHWLLNKLSINNTTHQWLMNKLGREATSKKIMMLFDKKIVQAETTELIYHLPLHRHNGG